MMLDEHKEALVKRFDEVIRMITVGGALQGAWRLQPSPHTPETLLFEVAVERLIGAVGKDAALGILKQAIEETGNANLTGRYN